MTSLLPAISLNNKTWLERGKLFFSPSGALHPPHRVPFIPPYFLNCKRPCKGFLKQRMSFWMTFCNLFLNSIKHLFVSCTGTRRHSHFLTCSCALTSKTEVRVCKNLCGKMISLSNPGKFCELVTKIIHYVVRLRQLSS